MSTLTRTARICFDIIIFALICLAELALRRWFTPFKRGFFCDDESLKYPYRENTISVLAVIIIVLTVPSLVIIVVELFRQLEPTAHEQQKPRSSGSHLGKRSIHCCAQVGYYLFGLGLTLLTTEIAKYSVGRLRPHFFDSCKPQLNDGTTCADAINHGRYITQYVCTAGTEKMREQVNLSFPSGHSSLLFYGMVYLAIYLQWTLSTRVSKLLKHLLQFIFVFFAWYVALTRVSDYWHHWSDVFAGAMIGTLFAIAQALFITNMFGGCSNRRELLKVKTASSTTTSAKSATPVLPAYTFGTLPYLHHAHQYGHAQPAAAYHTNYAYVP